MKARKVVTRSGRNYRGLFPSKKLLRHVEFESLLELGAILLFEFSPGVASYQEQPEIITYEQDGVLRRYFPDFEVILKNGEIIHFEIKPESKLKEPTTMKKYEAITNHYSKEGRHYSLLLDNRIRVEPRLTNLKRLATAHTDQADYEILLAEATKLVTIDPTFTFITLSTVFGMSHVMTLIGRGDLFIDLNRDMCAVDNFIRLPTEADHDSLLF